jgi:hypothetical protein
MNKYQKTLLAIGAVILVALIVRPPYFGVDRGSGGKVHAFIGYHWMWSPPAPAVVYEKLMGSDPAGADPARLASFTAGLNTVRMVRNIVVLCAAVAVGMLVLRKRTKGA